MVDVTFFFVVIFGGALVGAVAARVRGHSGWRKLADIVAGTLGGFAGTPIWLAVLPLITPHITDKTSSISAGTAALLSNVYYLSPVIGGLIGVGVLALGVRFLGARRAPEPLPRLIGHGVLIVGIVYLTIAVVLSAALVALIALQNEWSLFSPLALLFDLAYGSAIVLAGWAITRLAKPTGA